MTPERGDLLRRGCYSGPSARDLERFDMLAEWAADDAGRAEAATGPAPDDEMPADGAPT